MARVRKTGNTILSQQNFQLKDFKPLTDNQSLFMSKMVEGKHLLSLGYAGSGKTFLALLEAFRGVERGEYRKVVIVRSAVASRDVGFLKGDLAEKSLIYTLPYRKILSDLFGRGDAYEVLEKHDVLQFMLTSYVRGLTIDDACVIVDEAQNLTAHEADSILTRLGERSRLVICGDILQRDLTNNKEKDIEKFINVVKLMPDYFSFVYFGLDDIVRSGLVKEYIKTKHKVYEDGY
jgi:phosphate starvation-inducible protein PhoH